MRSVGPVHRKLSHRYDCRTCLARLVRLMLSLKPFRHINNVYINIHQPNSKFVLLRGKLAIHGQNDQRYLVLMHMSSKGQGLMVRAFSINLDFRKNKRAQESAPVIFFEEQT
jgi:hypothetical protein